MERLQNALKHKTDDSAGAESVDDLEEDLLNVSLPSSYSFRLTISYYRWMTMNI